MTTENNLQNEIEKLYFTIEFGLSINIDTLYKYKDLVFNGERIFDYQGLLTSILAIPIKKYDLTSKKYIPDQEKTKIQSELISLALDKGAKIDSSIDFDIETLHRNSELLLNRAVNPVDPSEFLKRTLGFSTTVWDSTLGKYIPDQEKIKMKSELISLALDKGANINVPEIRHIEITTVRELSKRGNIDDETMLKLTLKASCILWNNQKSSYDLDSVVLQCQLLRVYLAKGVKIDNLSFNELNIRNNHISVLRLLLENGLDPRALVLHSSENEDFLEVLNLAFEHNIKITPFNFIDALFAKELSTEVLKLIISSMGYGIDAKLNPEIVKNDFINQGPKFEEYFAELNKDVIFQDAIKPIFAEGGTILHILVKLDKKELVKYVLKNYPHDVNALNDLGQTPLFFVQSPEIAEALIEDQADFSIKDKKGNNWISNPSLEWIEFAVENKCLSVDYSKRVALAHFAKGNYEHAAKLYKIGFELDVNPVEQVVESIINGLNNSIEKNKYQAILQLINKAEIKIPNEFTYLLQDYSDDHKPEEFEFLYGLMHKLARHYINLSKAALSESIGVNKELDDAFKSFDFSKLKLMHPDNLVLARITNKFSAYYQIAGKALNIIDNDFALEALTINGLRPSPIGKDTIVYRGMKVNLTPDDIDAYFKFGHRGFSSGEYQKTLGFYVNQPWNQLGGRWEYGGTYSSVEAVWASHFANGITSSIEAERILLEINIPRNAPKICGSWKHEYELIPSSIAGENIIAIYTLDISNDKDGKHYKINKVHQNPYIGSKVAPHFKAYEEIKSDPQSIKAYNDLGCRDLPILSDMHKSGLYKNYTDFTERYLQKDYVSDQAKLIEDYFVGREPYIEEFSYGLSGECDLKIECCIYG